MDAGKMKTNTVVNLLLILLLAGCPSCRTTDKERGVWLLTRADGNRSTGPIHKSDQPYLEGVDGQVIEPQSAPWILALDGKDGVVTLQYTNGVLVTTPFVRGLKDGVETTWVPYGEDGPARRETTYRSGRQDGRSTGW